jgi:hypothetical protein
MPYDPRMLQMAQMGVRMMGPEQRDAFADPRSKQPRQWWEPAVQVGKPANRAVNTPDSEDPNDPERKKPQPSLLQMLMLGGPATYSGTPTPGGAAASPWGWLGSMGMPGGAGWGGGGGTPG